MVVLRLVDSDVKPAMGFIYEEMDCAKEKIRSNFNNIKKRIMKVDLSFPSNPSVSLDAKSLISRLLVKDSSRRLSLQKIMEHPWIVKNADFSGICL
ncbi:hypothetical protein LR48_Vigan02g057900 [Vigna angularis]|uniref:Protein kinase domain-containing protein n=1 Tax=Phaseolus angularis TaxID=3914 RepID=A0A0L9TW68_PHAAN|nr:hypothetical protein LR48_Vigan02g057900 [Vigna angularis]